MNHIKCFQHWNFQFESKRLHLGDQHSCPKRFTHAFKLTKKFLVKNLVKFLPKTPLICRLKSEIFDSSNLLEESFHAAFSEFLSFDAKVHWFRTIIYNQRLMIVNKLPFAWTLVSNESNVIEWKTAFDFVRAFDSKAVAVKLFKSDPPNSVCQTWIQKEEVQQLEEEALGGSLKRFDRLPNHAAKIML